ncbi:unnamed protein product [Agarophyton chilense]
MEEDKQEFEPTGMANFFQRYHEARASRSPPATPPATQPKPPSSPSTPSGTRLPKSAQSTWTKVFMPLGRPSTSANRYDLAPGQTSKPGHSVSELHAKGTGISLDAKNEEE